MALPGLERIEVGDVELIPVAAPRPPVGALFYEPASEPRETIFAAWCSLTARRLPRATISV